MTIPNETHSKIPTETEFDELLAFLPALSRKGFKPVRDWGELKKNDSGAVVMPGPMYDQVVLDLIGVLSQEVWNDYGYEPRNAWEMLQDPEKVAQAAFEEVKSMLTYFVRGERFSDGHWANMIETGHLQRLLERVAELRDESSRK